jgi:hypothetical protein
MHPEHTTMRQWVLDFARSTETRVEHLSLAVPPTHPEHWQETVPNTGVLQRAKIPTMCTTLKQRRMRWLGHVVCMDGCQISKNLVFSELAQWTRPTGKPQLRYKDVCNGDLKALGTDLRTREAVASEHSYWRSAVHSGLTKYEGTFVQQTTARRQLTKTRRITFDGAATEHISTQYRRDCHSRIGLTSQTKRCTRA